MLDGPKVALVSWENWTSRYGGDSSVVGRQVTFDNGTYTIVGVLPRGLGLDRTAPPAPFWTPALQSKYDQPSYHNRSFNAIGRLKPNVAASFCRGRGGAALYASSGDTTLAARVLNWQYDQTESTREPLYILLAASGILLLIGCVNVAMLMLGEATSRERELAARIAIGASRARVVRQLLAESMKTLPGAAPGAALAWALLAHACRDGSLSHSRNRFGRGRPRALAFASVCAVLGWRVLRSGAPQIARQSESNLLRVGVGQSLRAGREADAAMVRRERRSRFRSCTWYLRRRIAPRGAWVELSAVDPGSAAGG